MQQDYYGTKRVTAWPESKLKGSEPLLTVPADTQDAMPGYGVRYADGYTSWSPKEAFEAAYKPVTAMDFAGALVALKAGEHIARAGWNGKGMWLCLVTGWNGNFGGDLPVNWSTLPFIAMKTVDDALVPWLASQTDILADDWTIVS